jgi:hypothetical protein
MVEADADMMLVVEVLAVGDASFAQKCMDVFREKRRLGRTLVLVTHDMATVQAFCDRAMLIHDGEQRYLGDPEEAVLRYYRLNFGGADREGETRGADEVDVGLLDVWLEDSDGVRVENVEQGKPFAVNLVAQAHRELTGPVFAFQLLNVDDVPVLGFAKALGAEDEDPGRVGAGQKVRIAAKIANPLVPGRYSISCSIARSRRQSDLALHDVRILDFLIQGSEPTPGMVSVRADVEATLEISGR